MLKYRAREKKALYFVTHTTIQLYELPHVDQVVFLHQKILSALFFGDD